LFDKIRSGSFSFPVPYWEGVSAAAKDLISGLLRVDRKQRLTAGQVLTHPWIVAAA